MFPIYVPLLQRLDPLWLTSIRYAVAAVVLIVLLLAFEGWRALRLEGRGLLLFALGTSGIAVFNFFVLNGMKVSGPEHGALIVATGPLLTAIIARFRSGVRIAPITAAMIALAFFGVALVATKGDVAALLRGSALRDLMILLGVAGVAYYTAGAQSFSDWSPLRYTTISIGFGTVSTIVGTLALTALGLAHAPQTQLDAPLIAGMAYMIFVAAIFAFISWNFAISKIGPQNTMLFSNLVPIVTFGIELMQGHRFSAIEYAGALLTIGALVVNNLATRAPSAIPAVQREAA